MSLREGRIVEPSSRRESEGPGGKGLKSPCKVPAAGPSQPGAGEGTRRGRPCTRPGSGGLWQRPARGTRRDAAAPPGTFLLSSSRGWKIYKACSENIYTAAIFGGIWDVNLKNLWGEDHNGPFERASVAIAPTHPRQRGAPPAAAPALMGASPAGSPPGSRGATPDGPRRRPAPLIASRAALSRRRPRASRTGAVAGSGPYPAAEQCLLKSCRPQCGRQLARHGGDPRLRWRQPRRFSPLLLILSKSNIPRRAGPQPGKFQLER